MDMYQSINLQILLAISYGKMALLNLNPISFELNFHPFDEWCEGVAKFN